ncbi:MAG: TerD family protein [Planctomycetaceae bacterium]|jgi:tellurium resistance protein TerZ|nr:TerD family protein [Planctomycetaceae bacterium]
MYLYDRFTLFRGEASARTCFGIQGEKMALSLTKGQKISLTKEGGSGLTKVAMGLGWDAVRPKGILGFFSRPKEIDLDATCILFGTAKNIIDVVWFQQLQSKDGSIRHSGDNRTGVGDGDDETIVVDLTRVPANVTSLIFTINSFTGQTFDQIENAFCRLVNLANKQEIARYTLSGGGRVTAQIMSKIYRHNGEWKMAAIGEPANGQTFLDILPTVVPFV